MKKLLSFAMFVMAFVQLPGQEIPEIKVPTHDSLQWHVRTTNFPVMKELYFEPIAGAPILSQPQRIDGGEWEIRTEEHGMIYPTLYDWNKDGKPDLLLGEFLTGESRIKVYLNEGTKKKPKFSGKWFYATDVNGNVMSNDQWCCIGIHPQVVDIDGDGYEDIISGQYDPGVISLWRGSANGFLPREEIPQLGYQPGKQFVSFNEPCWSVESRDYWVYSSARLADFNGDGLLDLFVAGGGGFRVALNIGTKEQPKFGRREFLCHVDGSILCTRDYNEVVATGENFNAVNASGAGDFHTYLNPVDWDGDGVLDIIATDSYGDASSWGVYFFRGVETDDGLRFERPRPLFMAKDGSKALPGCAPQVQVVDYNGDGVNDLIIGLSIETINGFEGAEDVYWRWLSDMRIQFPGKDSGESLYFEGGVEWMEKHLKEDYKNYKGFYLGNLDDWKYLTLRHRGYPFILLGKKNPQKAVAIRQHAAPRHFEYDKPAAKKYELPQIDKKPVTCQGRVMKDKEGYYATIYMETTGTYHLYTAAAVNMNEPVKIEFELPEDVTLKGDLETPPTIVKGGSEIYDGKVLKFVQKLNVSPDLKGVLDVKIKVSYQSCDDDHCLPPTEVEIVEKLDLGE